MRNFISINDMLGNIENYGEYCRRRAVKELETCPVCGKNIMPKMYGNISDDRENTFINILECPSCREIIMVKYKKFERYDEEGEYFAYDIKDIWPKKFIEVKFDELIKNLSPNFVKIYNQALASEKYNLDEIAGIGYRKSIEYLIKDYLIKKNPEKKSEIESKFLGKCIDEIDDENIKSMARGAAWLGNDETHYVRKWKDKDIDDLKKLIDLTVYWIIFELKTEEYKTDMKL